MFLSATSSGTVLGPCKEKRQSSFQQITKELKLAAAKASHITKNDMTCEMNMSHKLLVCLVCDCFKMGSSFKIPRMTMSDIKKHSTNWEYNAMRNSTANLFMKTLSNNIMYLDSLVCCCRNVQKRWSRLLCCLSTL